MFLINVTQIDPIKYGLFFERFISKIRAKKQVIDGVTYLDGSRMPDVDLDICYYRRDEVLKYLGEIFKNKVAKILTLNTLSGKLLIKECGKIVEEKPEAEMTEVSSLIPKKYGIIRDIKDTFEGCKNDDGTEDEPVKEFVAWCNANKDVYNIALKLRNLIKNKGVHPSGVLVSHDDIAKTVPLELTTDKETGQKHSVSAFDMHWAALSNLKLDILGLRSVSVVHDVCKQLNLKMEDIDVNDPFIYQQLQDIKAPHGLFQIEAETNLKVCQHVRPKNIEELSAVLALARPGALQFVDQYATYTNTGEKGIVHPFFDDVLGPTANLCLYQESLMRMLNKVGFSLDESETARKIVGKKETERVKEWKEKIYTKVKDQNLPMEIADVLWKILNDSANYSFNRCLSPDTIIETDTTEKFLYEIKKGDKVKAFDVDKGVDHFVEVINVFNGTADLYEIELEDGRKIKASLKHGFLCEDEKMRSLEEVIFYQYRVICATKSALKVRSFESIGFRYTIDIEVNHQDHNFYAEGIAVSNSHAFSYASLSAAMIYLKFKYPKEFYLSLLKMTRHEPDPLSEIGKIEKELHYFGIKLCPPHVLKSELDFSIEGNNLRFGLLSIKGISDKSIEKLNKFRTQYSNKFEVFKGAEEAGLSIGILSAIIQAGALDNEMEDASKRLPRSKTVLEAQTWNLLSDKEKRYAFQLAEQFNYDLLKIVMHLKTVMDEKGKPVISCKENDKKPDDGKKRRYRYETIKKHYEPYLSIYNQNRKCEDFANWYYERTLLGYTYNKSLRDIFSKDIVLKSTIEINNAPPNTKVLLVGIVHEIKSGVSKKEKKTKYFRASISDEVGYTNVLLFNDSIEACKTMNGTLPVEGNIVIVKGVRKSDAVFAETIIVQDHKIYIKLSDLKSKTDIDTEGKIEDK